MNSAPSLPSPHAHPGQTPRASIVLIYDSFATALRGKAFFDELARKLEVPTDLGESLWRSELLAIPEIRQDAARAALAADFVVLALLGDEPLPSALDRWLGRWMPGGVEGGPRWHCGAPVRVGSSRQAIRPVALPSDEHREQVAEFVVHVGSAGHGLRDLGFYRLPEALALPCACATMVQRVAAKLPSGVPCIWGREEADDAACLH